MCDKIGEDRVGGYHASRSRNIGLVTPAIYPGVSRKLVDAAQMMVKMMLETVR